MPAPSRNPRPSPPHKNTKRTHFPHSTPTPQTSYAFQNEPNPAPRPRRALSLLLPVRLRLLLPILLFAALPALAQPAAEIQGTVVDARGGEALANVLVELTGAPYRATTDSAGRFHIPAIAPGDYTVNVSTVGYHVAKKAFHLDAGETKEFEVVLSPDTFHQTETVVARADPFETTRQDAPSALVLAGTDAKNLGSVLADDPLRAVQNLPGVSSNNDFDARFSLRGADFSRVGLYIDGVLLHEPFHMLEGISVSASGTAFNADIVEEMELYESAFPARYEDRSAGVLDVTTRDANRSADTFRVEASMSNAGFLAEGPIGKKKKGSWLVSARKSYLQYVLERTFPDNTLVFGMEDVQARLAYDLSPRNSFTLFVLESYSDLDRSSSKSTLGINSLMEAGYHYTLLNAGWRYSPSDKLLVKNHLAWMRERSTDSNPTNLPVSGDYYGEWVWNTDVTWMWNSRAPLEAGWSVRQLRDEGYANQYLTNQAAPLVKDHYDGNATRTGGYVQQSWLAWSGRLRLNAGERWDRNSLDQVSTTTPAASLSLRVASGTHFDLGWGEYVQYPEVSVLTSPLGNRGLLPERSIHAVAGFEQRLTARTRLRAEFYNRADRDMLFQPTIDPRLLLPKLTVFAPPSNPLYYNSLRGYARGAEFFLQRSSANRFTGWISYAFGRTGMHDGVTGNRFPSDFDQRHTVNVYGGYRLSPTVNLSLRWSYGSNFPIPGYLTKVGSLYYLTTVRDQLRLPSYQRADFRVNKAWTLKRWRASLYGEVVNLTNRTNYLFDSFNGYTTSTHQAYITLDKMFPILPSVGLVLER